DALALRPPICPHDVPSSIATNIVMDLEAVCREDCSNCLSQGDVACRPMTRAQNDLMVQHTPWAAGVAVKQQGVPVDRLYGPQQPLDGRIVGVIERLEPFLKLSRAESTRKNGHIAHRMRAHNPTPRTH